MGLVIATFERRRRFQEMKLESRISVPQLQIVVKWRDIGLYGGVGNIVFKGGVGMRDTSEKSGLVL